MGQRGPAAKPTQLKKLQGTHRADRAPGEVFPRLLEALAPPDQPGSTSGHEPRDPGGSGGGASHVAAATFCGRYTSVHVPPEVHAGRAAPNAPRSRPPPRRYQVVRL